MFLRNTKPPLLYSTCYRQLWVFTEDLIKNNKIKNMKNLKVFGAEIIDEKCITQIKNCFSENDLAVLTADAHYGYGHPIGGAIAYKDKVSLSGVGFDIACGNKAVRLHFIWF